MKKSFQLLSVLLPALLSLAFTGDSIIMPRGTAISVETLNEEKGDYMNVGYIMDFRVRDEVRVNNFVLVANSAPAEGEVIRVEYDEIQIEVRTVKAVDGKLINTRGRLVAARPCRKCPLVIRKATGIKAYVLDDVAVKY